MPVAVASIDLLTALEDTSPPPRSFNWQGQDWSLTSRPFARNPSVVWHDQVGHYYTNQQGVNRGIWRCFRCRIPLVLPKNSSPETAHRHLTRWHLKGQQRKKRDFDEVRVDEEEVEGPPTKTWKSLVVTFNEGRFRRHMTRWIVKRQISFIETEDPDFRAMLREANPTIDRCLVTRDTIRLWVQATYEKAQEEVRGVIATARSRIHISFDLWTSPNGLGIVAIVGHFVGLRNEAQSVLLGMKRMVTAHDGKLIGKVITPVLESYGIGPLNLGVFMADNAGSNDTAMEEILRVLGPGVTVAEVRGRCLAHVINLVAKAYLFGKDAEAFSIIADALDESNPDEDAMRTAQAHWRKKGAVGKLHNVVVFIRASPKRREWFKQVVDEEDEGVNGKLRWLCEVKY